MGASRSLVLECLVVYSPSLLLEVEMAFKGEEEIERDRNYWCSVHCSGLCRIRVQVRLIEKRRGREDENNSLGILFLSFFFWVAPDVGRVFFLFLLVLARNHAMAKERRGERVKEKVREEEKAAKDGAGHRAVCLGGRSFVFLFVPFRVPGKRVWVRERKRELCVGCFLTMLVGFAWFSPSCHDWMREKGR